MSSSHEEKLDSEWITLNAVKGLVKLATNGDKSQSTYKKALELGSVICPDILGEDSVLSKSKKSELTKEYIQRAKLKSIKENKNITPLSLVESDIEELESLVEIAKDAKDKQETDKLRNKLKHLYTSRKELNLEKNSENQLIFRDAYKSNNHLPLLTEGKNNKTFQLSNSNLLTIRVLHPEKSEHITGADLLYERYDKETDTVRIVLIQYKIWEEQKMYFSDDRMLQQLNKMKNFICGNEICRCKDDTLYRFPCCSGFLRPTDKLQNPNQAFRSTGEHLPLCLIDKCISQTKRGAKVLEYKNIKKVSLSQDIFEELFNQGKVGSRPLSLRELSELYKDTSIISDEDHKVLLYAQEYPY
jgi:ribosomal protein L7/L12